MENKGVGETHVVASSSEEALNLDSSERRPLTMDRDSIDLEAGPGEQPQCRICLESDGEFEFHATKYDIRLSESCYSEETD